MPKDRILEILPDIPHSPGIYQMLSSNGEILYIGKAKDLQKRVTYYTGPDLTIRLTKMIALVMQVEYITTKSETEALLLESRLIKTHQPKFNILLKDDKSFPYIVLRSNHTFPQILKQRSKALPQEKYFGPFASSVQVDATLEELQKIFKLRSCSDSYFMQRKRPCLQYQIKRCTAPCVQKISHSEYMELVNQAERFLSGDTINLQAELSQKMDILSKALEYEKAAEIRDRIKALRYIQLKFGADDIKVDNTDIVIVISEHEHHVILVAFYRHKQFYGYKTYFPTHANDATESELLAYFVERFYTDKPIPDEIITNVKSAHNVNLPQKILTPNRGNKLRIVQMFIPTAERALVEYLKKHLKQQQIFEQIGILFHLPKIPERIEIYDNSHIMGKYAVGAMVVATQEGFQKKEYRAHNIESTTVTGGDDYFMLSRVMTKRLAKIANQSSPAPDLMIIDGGIGHMSKMQLLMNKFKLNIAFVCMSKGQYRNSGCEQFHLPGHDAFTMSNRDPVMQYLQLLRDEAHNFAIKKHRTKRASATRFSVLEEIEGIGAKRKKDLLHFFGSVEAIHNASLEEITNVPNISSVMAAKIFKHLRHAY